MTTNKMTTMPLSLLTDKILLKCSTSSLRSVETFLPVSYNYFEVAVCTGVFEGTLVLTLLLSWQSFWPKILKFSCCYKFMAYFINVMNTLSKYYYWNPKIILRSKHYWAIRYSDRGCCFYLHIQLVTCHLNLVHFSFWSIISLKI